MLITLVLGIFAGLGAATAEPQVRRLLDEFLGAGEPVSPLEMRVFSFTICLLIAALLAWFFGNNSATTLALGVALGVFGPRVMQRLGAGRG